MMAQLSRVSYLRHADNYRFEHLAIYFIFQLVGEFHLIHTDLTLPLPQVLVLHTPAPDAKTLCRCCCPCCPTASPRRRWWRQRRWLAVSSLQGRLTARSCLQCCRLCWICLSQSFRKDSTQGSSHSPLDCAIQVGIKGFSLEMFFVRGVECYYSLINQDL